MQVVVMLAGVVEETRILAERSDHYLFKRLSFPRAALEELVAVVHVGLVMLVVVIFQCFARHVGRQRVVSIGQGRKRKRHLIFSVKTGSRPRTGRRGVLEAGRHVTISLRATGWFQITSSDWTVPFVPAITPGSIVGRHFAHG